MKKRITLISLATVILISVFAAIFFFTPDGNLAPSGIEDGISIEPDTVYQKYGGNGYLCERPLGSVPHTFEAWIYLTEEQAKTGVIFGNYDSHTTYYLNFSVKNANPSVSWSDAQENTYSAVFTEVNVCADEYVHIAVVHDAQQGRLHCYMNGRLMQSLEGYPDFAPQVINPQFSVAGDNRKLHSQFFKGKIHSVSVFESARTEKQIKRDMKKIDPENDELLVHYVLDKKADIEDLSKNGNDLIYSKLFYEPSEMESMRNKDFKREYSFAVIGDTQYMAHYNHDKMPALYNWIVDNKQEHNIQYVIGLGDITDRDVREEWDVAKNAVSILDGKVEYNLVRGNHDIKEGGDIFNEYFADSSFADQVKSRGGTFKEGDLSNTYDIKEIGKTKYLFLTLDYNPSDEVLEWAGNVISENSDCSVIISTHGYLHSDKTLITIGKNVWTKLASQYENIEMVLCGHISSNSVQFTQFRGEKGNTVTQVLVDAQDYDISLGGLGMIAMFYFDESGKNFEIEYYSSVLDKYYRTENYKQVDLEAEAPEYDNTRWSAAKQMPEGEGTEQSPYLISSPENLAWLSSSVKATTGEGSFEGMYFRQTNDIDLCGSVLKPIGCQYYSHDTEMYAFGGVYDGGGYSIKNGIISGADSDLNPVFTKEFGCGLFGAVYGGTVKNVVADNITVAGYGVTGVIVGKTCGKTDGSTQSDFNVIENCTVKPNCKIFSRSTEISDIESDPDQSEDAGIVGGIVGIGRSVSVRGCTSLADIRLHDAILTGGGIAGSCGYNSVIENCSFGGKVGYVGDMPSEREAIIGGTVGIFSPSYLTIDVGDNCIGTLDIKNCESGKYPEVGLHPEE